MPHVALVHHSWWTELRQRWQALQIALIVLAGAAVYSNSLQVQYVMDDYSVISFQGPKPLSEILLHGGPRRVADATFALNHHLHGLQVTGYHLVNLAVHLLAAVTLYFLVLSALGALRQSYGLAEATPDEAASIDRFVPCAVALLFALHPVQTQAVTYIIQRYTSLATLFYLMSALFFIRARCAWHTGGRLRQPAVLAAVSLAAGILAIGSKQIAATLPVMLLALELFLFRGRMVNRRLYIACGAAAVLVLALVLTVWHDRSLQEILASLHQATSEHHGFSRTTYFLTQLRVVATYLRLLCLPLDLRIFYAIPTYTSLLSLPVAAALCLHAALFTAAGLLFRASRNNLLSGRQLPGLLQRLASLGIVWFYIAMVVESSIFPITDVIFEHRIYLPSAGFFLTAVAGSALAARTISRGRKAVWVATAVVCLALGGMTYARNHVWSDTLLLWQDTVRKAPDKDLALANLAGEYMKLDQPDNALPLFVRALELSPVYMTTTKVHLGMTLQRLNIDRARFTTGEEIVDVGNIKGRVTLQPADEARLQCIMYNNLGLAREYLGDPARAREHYRAALSINPAYDLAWYNLGSVSLRLGDKGLAVYAMLQLKKYNPALAESLARELTR